MSYLLKYTGVIITIACLSSPIFGQNNFEKLIQFSSTSSGSSVIRLNDGSIIIGGYFGQKYQEAACLIRYTSDGEMLWAHQLDNQGLGSVISLALDSSGGFYATGLLDHYRTTKYCPFIARYDSNGSVQWTTRLFNNDLNGSSFKSASAIAVTRNGGCVVAGVLGGAGSYVAKFSISDSLEWLTYNEPSVGLPTITSVAVCYDGNIITGGISGSGIELLKYSSTGMILWRKFLTVSGKEIQMNSIALTSDSGFVVCGSISNGSGEHSTNADLFVAKFDSTGSVLWANKFDAFENEAGTSIIQTKAGDFVIAGIQSSLTVSSSFINDSMLFARVSATGTLSSLMISSLPNLVTTSTSIVEMSDGSFAIVGSANQQGYEQSNIIFSKLDANGNGCNMNRSLFSASPVTNFLIENTFKMVGYNDFATLIGTKDIPVIANDSDICAITIVTPSKNSSDFTLFPNPTNGIINISNPLEEKVQIKVTNLIGEEVESIISIQPTISIDLSKQHSGIYFASLITSKSVEIKKIVLY